MGRKYNVMKEIWKDIKEFEGLYQVSNHGNVRSLDREIHYLVKGKYNGKRFFKGQIISQYKINSGYLVVSLNKNGHNKKKLVHILVAEAFITNYENKPTVNHKNHIRTDNRVENLEWATYEEQWDEILREKNKEFLKNRDNSHLHTPEVVVKIRKALKGHSVSDDTRKKISDKNSKLIYQYTLDKVLINVYKSSVGAAKETGLTQAGISQAAIGKYYKHRDKKWVYTNKYKGYLWFHEPL